MCGGDRARRGFHDGDFRRGFPQSCFPSAHACASVSSLLNRPLSPGTFFRKRLFFQVFVDPDGDIGNALLRAREEAENYSGVPDENVDQGDGRRGTGCRVPSPEDDLENQENVGYMPNPLSWVARVTDHLRVGVLCAGVFRSARCAKRTVGTKICLKKNRAIKTNSSLQRC